MDPLSLLNIALRLLPALYSIGTRIKGAVSDAADDDDAVETVYTILDAVSDVVTDIRNALPPRPAGRGKLTSGA